MGKRKKGRAIRWCQMKHCDDGPEFSHGAASGVRHIDLATYQPTAARASVERPSAPNKTRDLLDEADKLLLRDAQRRHGKGYRKYIKNKIVQGRY